MTPRIGMTLARFVDAEERRDPAENAGLGAVLLEVARALREISSLLARGGVGDGAGAPIDGASGILLGACLRRPELAAVASEETGTDPAALNARGELLLAFEVCDGLAMLDANGPACAVFSVLRRPGSRDGAGSFLQPGSRQLCAGYAVYGPSTVLVLTTGRGVHGFTLDPGAGEFVLTHPDLRIPDEARELAIDPAQERSWEPPIRRYVNECRARRVAPPCAGLDEHWMGSAAADLHRVLVRGGVFVAPVGNGAAPLRLVHQASPMAMIVEQAGGLASTGRARLLDVCPSALDERLPTILGSRAEVERLVAYHSEHDRGLDRPYTSPLFNVRSVLRES